MKILREVKCSERLPNEDHDYLVDSKVLGRTILKFLKPDFYDSYGIHPITAIKSWFEEIETNITDFSNTGVDILSVLENNDILLKVIKEHQEEYEELVVKYENEKEINSKLVESESYLRSKLNKYHKLFDPMIDEDIEQAIKENKLTITKVIDKVIELNGIIGVGLITLGEELNNYCKFKL